MFPSRTTLPGGQRPAAILRKNSYCNRNESGADAQAVLMSVSRTLEQRGHDPITQVLATY
jgi:uncharacterized protein (UPF0297 family)